MNNEVSIGLGKLKERYITGEDINGFSCSIAQRGYLLCDNYRYFEVFDGSAEAAEYLLNLCKKFPNIEDEDEKKEVYGKAFTLLMGLMDAVRIELHEPSDYFTRDISKTKVEVPEDFSELPF